MPIDKSKLGSITRTMVATDETNTITDYITKSILSGKKKASTRSFNFWLYKQKIWWDELETTDKIISIVLIPITLPLAIVFVVIPFLLGVLFLLVQYVLGKREW
jgi:hypothetical protein